MSLNQYLCLYLSSLSVLIAILNSSSILLAQENIDTEASVAEIVAGLDAKIASASQAENTTRKEIRDVRKRLSEVDREWKNLEGQLESIRKEQQQLMKKLNDQLEAANKAFELYQSEQNKAEDAQKAAEEAARKLKEQKKLADDAFQESEMLATIPIQTKQMIAKIEEKIPDIEKSLQSKKASQKVILERIHQLQTDVDRYSKSQKQSRAEIESTLKSAGQWVSFSEEIAPIIHERCVACHNSKTAQGQYNMSTYEDILSEGESGETIIMGDKENSLLSIMIEDESMPKDSDPLTPDQISSIKNWIQLGARLDHDVEPDEPLIRIMPRKKQPAAPENYRVPVPVTALAVHPQNQIIASSGYHEVLLWSLKGELIGRIGNLAERIYGLAFHPDGSRIAVASGTPGRLGEVKLFHVESGHLLQDLFISGDAMFDVEWSHSGDRLAACGADGSIVLFGSEAGNDNLIQELSILDHADWVHTIDWSENDEKLVSASRDQTAKVFDSKSGDLLLTFNKHDEKVFGAEWIPGSKEISSMGGDHRIRIWNSTDAKEIRNLKLTDDHTKLIVIKNQFSISGGHLGTVHVNNLVDGKQASQESITEDWISCLAISRDLKHLIIGDHSGALSLLKVSEDLKTLSQSRRWIAVPQNENQ